MGGQPDPATGEQRGARDCAHLPRADELEQLETRVRTKQSSSSRQVICAKPASRERALCEMLEGAPALDRPAGLRCALARPPGAVQATGRPSAAETPGLTTSRWPQDSASGAEGSCAWPSVGWLRSRQSSQSRTRTSRLGKAVRVQERYTS